MIVRRFHSALTNCLESMRLGASVGDCLARYPRYADRLRPYLELADKVSRTPLASARPRAKEQAWLLLQKRAAELKHGRRGVPLPTVRAPGLGWLKPVAFTAVIVLAFSAASGTMVYAAQDALPDSPLYRVKLATEDVRLWFVFDDVNEAQILLDQSDERITEIMAMVRKGEPVPENALSALNDRNQRAAGILASRPEETGLRARVLLQAQQQEELLLALWPQVPESARTRYAEAVAHLHNVRLDRPADSAFVTLRPEELAGGILSISGQAEQVTDGVWRIGGVEVRIDDRTFGRDAVEHGGTARVVVARASNGRLHALNLTSLQTGPSSAFVSGAVEEVTSEGFRINGQWISRSAQTLETTPIRPGDRVQISVQNTGTGLVASTVRSMSAAQAGDGESLWFEGTLRGDVSRDTSRWEIGGFSFRITAGTSFDARGGPAVDGARINVEALNRNGELFARRIIVLNSQAPADTASVLGAFDGYDSNLGVWLISGVPVVPPEVGDDPTVGALVVVETKREAGELLAVSYYVIEEPGRPSGFQMQGTIREIDGSRWTLEIGDVRVISTSDVHGKPEVGVRVFIWGERAQDGALYADYARILDQQSILPSPTPEPEPAAATN